METPPSKKLILAGGSGFLGQELAAFFAAKGFEIVLFSRSAGGEGRARLVGWDGVSLGSWAKELEGASAVINLAGRTVNCRYNARNRQEIMESRTASTAILGEAIARCEMPPPVWLNLSTATIYRHTLGPAWDESGEIAGTPEVKDEFSVEVAQRWEEKLQKAPTPRTRKVALRSAMVLGHAANSVFPTLLRLAKFGLGGRMGSGKQFVSWIHAEDFCRAVEWLIDHEELSGVVNLAAPNPLTNAEMMRVMRRAAGMPIGLPALRPMLEVGAVFLRTETELILKSRRVISRRLGESGFKFRFETFEEAVRNLAGG